MVINRLGKQHKVGDTVVSAGFLVSPTRDGSWGSVGSTAKVGTIGDKGCLDHARFFAVSYTHLTLPTSDLV